MDVREATHDDASGIRRVAEASLEATYAGQLGDDIVDAAAEEWYGGDRLDDRLDADDVVYLVVVDGDEVVAFSESELDVRQPEGDASGSSAGVAAIQWLHVHPDHRGRGFGGRLLERTEAALFERTANRVEGRVLAANEEGNEFYQASGYARTGERTLDIGGDSYTEHLYVKLPEGNAAELTEEHEVEDGTVFVAYDERERGSRAPFYAAYRTQDRQRRYGFYCAACGSLDTSMNSMGRIQCESCDNKRKATRWDSSYL
ncbi:GNAT family N-acetyltransferase [Halobacterium sp. R2-5]|uniref:GNAT family N-acetyltransferase n=1 Tax=Halobacterium sp. R2-5 TaxID=2715751 RepID=UPI001420D697|nr:GNAT family N-acetyltransferase [Halobacterium sp. R2-5]NIB98885.1 GNAT family N-acetyltransferase [Halobacterium sp. R2-5]